MKLAGIPTLVRKFVRETWAFGPLSAARKSVKGVANRSGLASIEQVDMLVSAVQSLEDEVSSRSLEEARLRQQIDAIRETTSRAIQILGDEISARRQEEARLRLQIDAIQAAIASAVQALGDETSARGQELVRLHEQTNAIQEDLANARATLAALESQRSSEATFVDASELRALTLRLDTDAARIHSALAVPTLIPSSTVLPRGHVSLEVSGGRPQFRRKADQRMRLPPP